MAGKKKAPRGQMKRADKNRAKAKPKGKRVRRLSGPHINTEVSGLTRQQRKTGQRILTNLRKTSGVKTGLVVNKPKKNP